MSVSLFFSFICSTRFFGVFLCFVLVWFVLGGVMGGGGWLVGHGEEFVFVFISSSFCFWVISSFVSVFFFFLCLFSFLCHCFFSVSNCIDIYLFVIWKKAITPLCIDFCVKKYCIISYTQRKQTR